MSKSVELNFKIIVTKDILLAEHIINKAFGGFGPYRIVTDPIESKSIFTSKSFIDNSKRCYVCRDLTSLIKADKCWDSLYSGKFLNGNALVYVVDKLDSRTKFAKKFKSFVETPDGRKFNIEDVIPNCQNIARNRLCELFELCEYNFTPMGNELNKINNLAQFENISNDEAYDKLKLSDNLPKSVDDNIFNLIDDIMTRKVYKVYDKLYTMGKSTFDFGLLVNLYTKFRNLLVYKSSVQSGTLNSSGLNSFELRDLPKYDKFFTVEQTVHILKVLASVDKGIKQGKLSSDYMMDYLLAGVFS